MIREWSPGAMGEDELVRYASLIVGCVDLRPGDQLLVLANYAHRELAVAIAERAYCAGALTVDVAYEDNRVRAAKIRHATDAAIGHAAAWQTARWRALGAEQVAFVDIRSDFELAVLAPLSAERLATDAAPRSRHLGALRRERRLRGTICAWPTKEWAARVYPELEHTQAQHRLAQDLLAFCRISPEDPADHAGWTQHVATLRARAAALTDLDLKELHVRDDRTDLRLRIAPHSCWASVGEQDRWGHRIAMNVPSEECFISPDAAAGEGTFHCTRPRTIAGRVLDGLSGEFRGGRLVRLKAPRESDRDWLASYLAPIGNADRIGEIALVDSSSRIGATGRTYYHALLDENATAHFALGSGLAKTRTLPLGRNRYGVNRSNVHIDLMIGTTGLTATGTTHTGRRVPLIADGTWQLT